MLITQYPKDLIQVFQQGCIFAYPTEAIYGLGCDPDNEASVLRLLEIKQRPIEKGLILIAADFSQVSKYLKPVNKLPNKFTQPSETTYTFPALEATPQYLKGSFDSLAIRITKHPLIQQFCKLINSPLVSTSANFSGQPPAETFAEVLEMFEQTDSNQSIYIDAILKGKTGGSIKPSTIRDAISGEIIRS